MDPFETMVQFVFACHPEFSVQDPTPGSPPGRERVQNDILGENDLGAFSS